MRRLTCLIEVVSAEGLTTQFKNVNLVTIESSYENLTDVCEITVPNKIDFEGKIIAADGGIFSRGDKVTVWLGYDLVNTIAFRGYLVDIKPGSPIVLRCEDEMFSFKKSKITKSYAGSVTLKNVLSDLTSNVSKAVGRSIQFKALDINLGKFRIELSPTPAKVIAGIREIYGVKSFFRNGILYSGLDFWPELQNPEPPAFEFNLNIISHDLTYQNADDVRYRVRATAIGKNNVEVVYENGDPEGEQRTLHYYDKTAAELKVIADQDLRRFKYTGYRGSFTTFGEPFVNHGDIIELTDKKIPDRNGKYIVKKVNRKFGEGGYRQEITLEAKV